MEKRTSVAEIIWLQDVSMTWYDDGLCAQGAAREQSGCHLGSGWQLCPSHPACSDSIHISHRQGESGPRWTPTSQPREPGYFGACRLRWMETMKFGRQNWTNDSGVSAPKMRRQQTWMEAWTERQGWSLCESASHPISSIIAMATGVIQSAEWAWTCFLFLFFSLGPFLCKRLYKEEIEGRIWEPLIFQGPDFLL